MFLLVLSVFLWAAACSYCTLLSIAWLLLTSSLFLSVPLLLLSVPLLLLSVPLLLLSSPSPSVPIDYTSLFLSAQPCSCLLLSCSCRLLARLFLLTILACSCQRLTCSCLFLSCFCRLLAPPFQLTIYCTSLFLLAPRPYS